MNFEKRDDVSLPEYLEMIRQKTAVLLAGSMQIGALIGGAAPDQAKLLYDFGENLGLAFQLQDDILDVYGNPEKFGKQVGGDILSNKKTFLLIKAKELAKGDTASELDQWIKTTNEPIAKVNAVTTIYNLLELRKLAEIEMEEYVNKALKALDLIAVDRSKKELLRGFAEQLLIREY
jgi:geranylgeranyl diphosphate synthase type II